MSWPEEGAPVAGDHVVLRLPAPPKDFVPDGWRPTHQEVAPSEADKRAAAARGMPVRVSVWDETRTTVAEARSFRGRTVLVLSAGVEAVLSRGATAVVYDRLDPPESERPGAEGHAGIEGLDRPSGEPKVIWRARLQAVAECFVVRGTL